MNIFQTHDVHFKNTSLIVNDQNSLDMLTVAEQENNITPIYLQDLINIVKLELPPDKHDEAQHFYISEGPYLSRSVPKHS